MKGGGVRSLWECEGCMAARWQAGKAGSPRTTPAWCWYPHVCAPLRGRAGVGEARRWCRWGGQWGDMRADVMGGCGNRWRNRWIVSSSPGSGHQWGQAGCASEGGRQLSDWGWGQWGLVQARGCWINETEREGDNEASRVNAMTHLLTKLLTRYLPFTELLPCTATPLQKPNPEPTLNADCTSTARAPGLHQPIHFVTHPPASMADGTARKGDGKQRVLARDC
jgi:hypothetical protein